MEVVGLDGVLDGYGRVFVGRAMDVAAFHAAAGEPHDEALIVVVAFVIAAAIGGAAELAAQSTSVSCSKPRPSILLSSFGGPVS